jgi:hypothetical protein
MKAIYRRLRRLEERVAAQDFQAPAWVEVLRERRRRRLEANGLPYEPVRDPIPHVNGRRPTWAEVLRYRRSPRTAAAASRRAAEAEPTTAPAGIDPPKQTPTDIYY